MLNEYLHNVMLFMEIARAQSFTRAAARLGLSQSSLSHAMRGLEQAMGVRLLARTTRRVSTTEAGERLLQNVAPLIAAIDDELAEIRKMGSEICGRIRLTATEYAAQMILWPKISPSLDHHPGLKIEVSIDHGLTDIVRERFDAGVRLGDRLDKDMVAVRIGPDINMAVTATPAYFEKHGFPQHPSDLAAHNCINLRPSAHSSLHAWQFGKNGRRFRIKVGDQLVFNTLWQMFTACPQSFGLACLSEKVVEPELAKGNLVRVLKSWCPPLTGHHLYYPNRRQHSAAFSLLLKTLRYRDA